MTCIVGLIDGRTNQIVLGGDSAGVGGYHLTQRRDSKVFRVGEFAMGFTTSFRMGQLLRVKFDPPPIGAKQDLFKYMVDPFIEAVRTVLKAGGFALVKDNVETGGVFIVGVRGRLFQIDDDFHVGEAIAPFTSVGCGAAYAEGSLFATQKLKQSARTRVRQALEAAEYFSAGVRGPFTFVTTPGVPKCRS
jgi:hypothetical protein